MRLHKPILPLLLILAAASACVTASTTSFVNNAVVDATVATEPVLVWFPVPDLTLRTESEQAFVTAMEEQGAAALAGVDVLFPSREYTPEEIVAAAEAAGANSIMLVTISAAEAGATPATGFATCLYVDANGNCTQVMTSAAAGRIIPGNASFRFNLYSSDGASDLWTAVVDTKNQAGQLTDGQDMVSKAMQAAAEQLAEDGLIGR